MTTVKGFRIRV